MNYKALKYIYIAVLKWGSKIQYHGDDKYIITSYYPNGNKYWEREYQNGKLHGKYIGWWENGNKSWEGKYHQGKLIQ